MLSFAADGLDANGLQREEIGHFFQVLPVYFGDIAKSDLQLVLHWRNHLFFSSHWYTNNFKLEKKFYAKYFSSFDKKKANCLQQFPFNLFH